MKNNKLLAILLSVLLVSLCGCNPGTDVSGITEGEINYSTVIIEEHEYIIYRGYAGVKQLTHKGNCKAH